MISVHRVSESEEGETSDGRCRSTLHQKSLFFYLEGWHNQSIGNGETIMVRFYWFWDSLLDWFCSRTRLLSDRSRRPYHYNSQVIIHQNHRHHNQSAIMIIVAVITIIMPVLLIIPTLMQVDLQGQPRAGTVEADPLEETRYRRSLLAVLNSCFSFMNLSIEKNCHSNTFTMSWK